ncbi:MAG: HU family DNA-binding protein [Rickettsia endosymbiont of Bryobia graminum]|nr:HU family DNA-binding protein [Rickettsia endosymbiont of Bryobia graminum]
MNKKKTSKGESLNKGEFVTLMAESNTISKTEAEKSINMVIDSLLKAFTKGKGVALVGFGSFNIQHRAAREGRNPKTGAKMKINSYNQLVFKVGQGTKDACNGKLKPKPAPKAKAKAKAKK